MDIFILSCSAGLNTQYTHLTSTLLQDQPRFCSDQIAGNTMELVKSSHQTNRGVGPCRGVSAVGETLDIYMQIFLVLALNFSSPSSPLLQLANHSSWYFQIFSVSLQDSARALPSSPQLICLLCRFQFQFYRRRNFSYLLVVTLLTSYSAMLAAPAGLSVLPGSSGVHWLW